MEDDEGEGVTIWWKVSPPSQEEGVSPNPLDSFLVLVVGDRVAVVTRRAYYLFEVGDLWTTVQRTLKNRGFECEIDQ